MNTSKTVVQAVKAQVAEDEKFPCIAGMNTWFFQLDKGNLPLAMAMCTNYSRETKRLNGGVLPRS